MIWVWAAWSGFDWDIRSRRFVLALGFSWVRHPKFIKPPNYHRRYTYPERVISRYERKLTEVSPNYALMLSLRWVTKWLAAFWRSFIWEVKARRQTLGFVQQGMRLPLYKYRASYPERVIIQYRCLDDYGIPGVE